ncbi:hypothetical protein ZWY2020_024583 [Hordeum vulgare]|nr:hypothetical protein ZWY2020_024583 [Hordeum vulgare]
MERRCIGLVSPGPATREGHAGKKDLTGGPATPRSVFAFDVASRARGVAIHSTPRNGRSLLPYAADSTIFLDGEPKLVDYGHDGCLLMLQVCLDEVLLNDREAKNLQLKHDLLSSTFRYCLDKTYFSTCFCEALMRIKTATDGLLETLSSVLELSAAEKVGIGLALSDSDNSGMKLKEVGQSPFFAPIPKEQYDAQSINPSRHLEMYLDSTNDDFESLLSEIGKEISMADIVPSTNWVHVMENLDHEGFSIPVEATFCLLMNIYGRACKDPFPLHAVCGPMWTNTEGQISFLKHAISAPATIFTFAHSSRLLALPDFASLIPGNHAWSCLDLLEENHDSGKEVY